MGEILAFLKAKNDDEKWSRKDIFEIPPCASHFLLNDLPHKKEEFWSKAQIQ